MKKILLAGIAALFAIGSTSCLKEAKNDTTLNKLVTSFNLVTATDGAGSPVVTKSNYTVTVKYPDNTLQLSTEGLSLPGGGVAGFTTTEMNLKSEGYVTVDDKACEVIGFEAADATGSGDKVTALKGLLTQGAYAPGSTIIEGFTRIVPCQSLHYLVMSYQLNNRWLVRTFWPDMTFRGTTSTTFPGMEVPYSSEGIAYRVVMHLDESSAITDKADIIFYGAKFAPAAPEITVVLKDLDLTFSNEGYKITGKEVVPYMVEAGQLQETPRFIFNTVEFESSGNLTAGTCAYTVAGMFHGSFSGNSVVMN